AGRRGLRGVREGYAPSSTVSEQALKMREVVGRRYDEHIADASQHQRRDRIVNQRLVVDRRQLLGDGARDRIKARAKAAGENDSLHSILHPEAAIASTQTANASCHRRMRTS